MDSKPNLDAMMMPDIKSDAETRDEAVYQTDASTADESDSESLLSRGSQVADDDSSESEESDDGACSDGQSPLHEACKKGDINALKSLLANDSNTQATDNKDRSPLYLASRYGHEEIVRCLLVENSSNIDDVEETVGWTALHAAIYYGHAAVVSVLLDEGAAVGKTGKDGWTPLMTATIQQHSEILKTLLDRKYDGIQLETPDEKFGRTPLLWASIHGFLDGVNLLIAAGANVNATSRRSGSTPLMAASTWRYGQIVQALIAAEAKVDALSLDHSTALHSASKENNVKIVQLILQESVLSVNEVDEDGQTPLHFASKQGNEQVVRLLLNKGSHVDEADNDGKTALHLASGAGDDDRSQQDPDDVGPDDLTPKERDNPQFQSGRHLAVIKLLLEKDANPRTRTKKGETVLHLAAAPGDPERLQVLLERMKSEDLSAQDTDGETALCTAFKGKMREPLELVKEFIKRQKQSSISAGQKVQDISKPDTSTPSRQVKTKSEEKGRDKNKTSHEEQRTEVKEKDPIGLQLIDLETIKDILEDPPFAQMHKDRKGYKLPRPKEGLEDVLQTFGATIVRFYKGMDESGTVRRGRPVQEVIYDAGPTKIMKMAVDNLERIISTDSELPGHTVNLKSEPRFTWVHLPSTNDLLTRIMKDKRYKAPQYHEVRSFFRDSWTEVPDSKSPLRSMRPGAVVKEKEKAADQSFVNTIETPEGPDHVAASATYMPYVFFSTLCPDGTPPWLDEKQKRYKKVEDDYGILLDRYEGSVIHGSPTLDEWYYHFETGSIGDRNRRNRNQVVTRFLKGDKSSPMLRVNQLWIWTIDEVTIG
ncbi:kinase D-interacting substrate [Colletotrichum liriopes]|uniref:Kinase D-interacting substrate n=1 Tax=Colletotrichum liriopes TaxID=708192 RepID=A0AA37LZC2_9PEZI|nr:kinase D-interacting substrate [Colletotrichum liriopes]